MRIPGFREAKQAKFTSNKYHTVLFHSIFELVTHLAFRILPNKIVFNLWKSFVRRKNRTTWHILKTYKFVHFHNIILTPS